MPASDKFFQYLLALSLLGNPLLDEVVVVNHSHDDSMRIASFFRRLYERGRIQIPQSSFSSWARQGGLQNATKQIYRSEKFAW